VSDVEYSFKIQGACPDGWRMPDDEDWLELEMELGISENEVLNYDMRGTDEGNKLKSTSEWASNGNGTDETGFSVFPAGKRDGDSFKEMFYYSYFWAGIEKYEHQTLNRWLAFDQGGIGRDGGGGGFSIRCIYGNATPTVATTEISDITNSSATVGCYVSSDGGEYVEESGIYYGTSKNPETTGTKVQISGALGTHTFNLTGLLPTTTYYVKAYAMNSIGVNYGNEIEFSTLTEAIFFEEDFTDNITGFNTYNVLGDQEWGWLSYDNGCASISGYSGEFYENKNWLISPSIDLSDKNNVFLTIREACNHLTTYDDIQVLVSEDYDGLSDPSGQGTWNVLTGFTRPSGSDWDFVSSGDIDLTAYVGFESFYVAFKYTSTSTEATSWEIGNIILKEKFVKR